MIKVSIVGITGYVGAELARLLGRRADVQLVEVIGRSAAGQTLAKVFPHLGPLDIIIQEELRHPEQADFVFLALPHHASAETAAAILEKAPNTKVIDMSADFRLKDVAIYEQWYGHHPASYLLKEAVYGLPELNRAAFTPTTRLVANPGCFPTCSSLALAPALSSKMGGPIIEPDVIISALTGVSGGGRGLKQGFHFSEMNESVSAYSLDGHRHLPETAQMLAQVYGGAVEVTFIPHLVPLTRGMLATCYARFTPDFWASYKANPAELKTVLPQRYREFYANDPFIRIVDEPPTTKQVQASNYCYIYPSFDPRTGRLVVVSVIDNLVKGAAGAGVQNMNLLAGLPESFGLDMLPVYP